MTTVETIAAVIPVFRPSKVFGDVLDALMCQTYGVIRLVVIDSSPDGEGEKFLRLKNGLNKELALKNTAFTYVRIIPEEFDHGRTRNMGVELTGEVDAVLFLTQDAVMQTDCLERLVDYLNVHNLAAAFARQLPRPGASCLEKAERLRIYPPISRVSQGEPKSIDDVFFSDACSLVRKDALQACGGFPDRIITAEDMIVAARLLKHGYRIGYCAEALVTHSHALGFRQVFKRYFDIGVMHADWEDFIPVKTASSKGAGLVWFQVKQLLKYEPLALWVLAVNVAGKYLGYRLGRHYHTIPLRLRQKFSQNSNYWRL